MNSYKTYIDTEMTSDNKNFIFQILIFYGDELGFLDYKWQTSWKTDFS